MKQRPEQLVSAYLRDIETGRRNAGRMELAAVERYRRDLREAGKRGWVLDERLGGRAIEFMQTLRITKGELAGEPLNPQPWQAFILMNIFGWVGEATRYRRFRRALIQLARGNGKTPLGAAIALYCTGFDEPVEPEAEGYCTATKADQARLAFNQAKRFIEADRQGLSKLAETYQNHIEFPATGAVLKPVSSDAKSADGYNPQIVLKDELHAWTHLYREFNEKLETAMAKRRQSLELMLTTAGDDNSDIWIAEDAFARSVLLDGVEADDFFAFVCEIDGDPVHEAQTGVPADDPLDEKCWPKANPMLDYSTVVKIDAIRSLAKRARYDTEKLHNLKRYHCNKQVSAHSKLFADGVWSLGNQPLPWEQIDQAEVFAYCALDWGWKDDLAALGWVFDLGLVDEEDPDNSRRIYGLHCDVWLPESSKRDVTRKPWSEWVEQGWVTLTKGKTTDVAAIYRTFDDRYQTWYTRGAAYDGNNAREWGSRLEHEYGLKAYAMPQTPAKYHEPTRELTVALQEGRVKHGGNPVLAWAAKNALGKSDTQGLIMPDKQRSIDKIDPIVTVIMALRECMFVAGSLNSYYADNDLELG